ncbi:hypothetical protein T4C_11335 [Trichinella pseudospiralis]|uniref:Uncharacterized protein n=1 Tax=Trichinella pseudospiralis TaxID=6337 RepID=A0A0V1GJY0_TRIPS|nr:hypothetical protein T4C_11335 [Trichinella pseudospiralis]
MYSILLFFVLCFDDSPLIQKMNIKITIGSTLTA